MERSREYYDLEYIQKKRSIREIAEEFGTYPNKIRRELVKMGYLLRDRSESQINAISSGRHRHPTKGTKRPDEVKQKISEKLANSWSSIDEQERLRRTEKARTQWKNMTSQEKDFFRSSGVDAVRQTIKTGSKLEKYLLENLQNMGYEVDFHRDGLIPSEKLQMDLFLPEVNVVIEIDGPSHFLPIWGEERLEKTMEADHKKNSILISHGFVVVRVRNIMKTISDINKRDLLLNVVNCIKKVEDNFPDLQDRLITIDLK